VPGFSLARAYSEEAGGTVELKKREQKTRIWSEAASEGALTLERTVELGISRGHALAAGPGVKLL
jgi:hypothetical protein